MSNYMAKEKRIQRHQSANFHRRRNNKCGGCGTQVGEHQLLCTDCKIVAVAVPSDLKSLQNIQGESL